MHVKVKARECMLRQVSKALTIYTQKGMLPVRTEMLDAWGHWWAHRLRGDSQGRLAFKDYLCLQYK